jgi:hypothetical protein
MRTGGLVQVGLAAPDAENVRSGLGEGNRGSTADPGSCSGDDHYPAGEVMVRCVRAEPVPLTCRRLRVQKAAQACSDSHCSAVSLSHPLSNHLQSHYPQAADSRGDGLDDAVWGVCGQHGCALQSGRGEECVVLVEGAFLPRADRKHVHVNQGSPTGMA